MEVQDLMARHLQINTWQNSGAWVAGCQSPACRLNRGQCCSYKIIACVLSCVISLTAFALENIRNSRWLIGSGGRGVTPYWQSVETVNAGKQLLFMQRVLFVFIIRKKQVKNLATARCSPEQWEMMLETSCLLHQLLEDMKAATDAVGAPIFRPDDVSKARQRALEGRLHSNPRCSGLWSLLHD